jgi:putative endonuclease
VKKYFVYILRTSKNTLYTGQTVDLKRRLEQHKNGKVGAKYLRMFASIELVYSEEVAGLSEALKREIEIKTMSKTKKENLIKLANDKNKEISRK